MPNFVRGVQQLKELLARANGDDAIVVYPVNAGMWYGPQTVVLLWRDEHGDMNMVTMFKHKNVANAIEARHRLQAFQAAQRPGRRTVVCKLAPYQRLVCWEVPRNEERPTTTQSNPFCWG